MADLDAQAVWLHSSPAHIADGDWVVPAAELGGRSRTHPNGYGELERIWYSPDVVYVFDSCGVDPIQHLKRFAFTSDASFMYVVDPLPPFGCDLDVGQAAFKSMTCSRAQVLRCVHRPDTEAGGQGQS